MKLPFLQPAKTEEQVQMISIDKIIPNPYQPRKSFQEEEIKELAESIDNYGVIQPVILRMQGEKFELIAGERRLRACKYLGLEKIPAIVKDFLDQEIAEIALIENLQRKDLDFLEEAQAYQFLLEKFKLTQQELAQRIGKSQSTIANKLRLLNLATEVRQQIDPQIISERHARALLKLPRPEEQLKVLHKIKENNLTVKETEKMIKNYLSKEKNKPRRITVFKDLRLFTNSLKKTIAEMQEAGLAVEVEKEEDEEFLEFTIRLPKRKG